MAGKEATVYIVDVGDSMTECHNGRVESDLDWGMQYVWDKIFNTVAANRKTWTVGVIGLRTEETNNPQQRDGLKGYENISVLQELGPMSTTQLRELTEKVEPSTARTGDAISAIIVAISMIEEFTKALQYNRNIVLVTDASAPIDEEEISEVAAKLNDVGTEGIELTVLGIDFDDSEYGFKEEDKLGLKAKNEALLRNLVGQCKRGVFGTMAEAIAELETPRIKATKPYKAYGGPLTLGDPENYESALCIHVERYFRTKRAIPPSTSTKTRAAPSGLSQSSQPPPEIENGEGTTDETVKSTRTYKVEDADAPGGKKEVPFGDLAKGYMYGRAVVPISESDQNVTKLETKKGFSIIGFIPFSSYEPFMNMAETGVIIAQKYEEQSELALSSLINALHELESYAVARYVEKDGKDPRILLLKPNPKLEDDFECLYDVPLPFAEDVRSYQFAPLDKVVTVTGSVLTTHRLLPGDELSEAMSNYVDSMDLSACSKDENGEPAEYAAIPDSFNPMIHHIKKVVQVRALHPDRPLPSPSQTLMRFSQPPEDIVGKNKAQIEKLIELAEVKKIPEKAKFKRARKEDVAISSAIPLDELLQQKKDLPFHPAKRNRPSAANGIPEFKQAIQESARRSDVSISDSIAAATKEFGEITRKLIEDSFASTLYEQAEANIRVMRRELLIQDEPGLYNSFIRTLKKSLLSGELNGDRRDMWRDHIVAQQLGLITKDESDVTETTDSEALEFLKATT